VRIILKFQSIERLTCLPEGHLERQLIDDAHRKDLTPLERAWAYAAAIININIGGNFTIPEVKRMEREKLINLLTLGENSGRGQKAGTAALSRKVRLHFLLKSQFLANVLKS